MHPLFAVMHLKLVPRAQKTLSPALLAQVAVYVGHVLQTHIFSSSPTFAFAWLAGIFAIDFIAFVKVSSGKTHVVLVDIAICFHILQKTGSIRDPAFRSASPFS